ncbi:MAG: hypothetical protein FWF81_10985 [Defluviitaleaceae bacterium]|nr:hypothetical protein [Defluviitaleaceae bacterium]
MPRSRKIIVKIIEILIYILLLTGPLIAIVHEQEMYVRNIRTIAVMAIAAIIIFTFFKRGINFGQEIIFLCAVVFIGISLFAANAGNFSLVAICAGLLLVSVVLCLVLLHMTQMDTTLDVMQNSSAQPVKRIINFNYKLVAALGVGILVFSLVIYFAVVSPIMNAVVSAIPQLDVLSPPPTVERHFTPPQGRYSDLIVPEQRGFFVEPLMPIMGTLIGIIFSIVGVVIVSYIIFVIIRAILIRLSNHKRYYDAFFKSSDSEDEKEFIFSSNKKAKIPRSKNENEIRRLFRETISRHIKFGVEIKNSDTPSEMAAKIITEDISELAEKYSPIRYNASE